MKINSFKYSVSILLLSIFIGCQNNKDTISIKVKASNYNDILNKKVYLFSYESQQKIDSVKVINNESIQFNLKKQSYEKLYAVFLKNQNPNNSNFFAGLNDQTIKISQQKDGYGYNQTKIINISESKKEQKEYKKYLAVLDENTKEYDELLVKFNALKKENKLNIPELRKPIDSMFIRNQQEMENINLSYFKEYKNATSLYLLNTAYRFKYGSKAIDSILKKYPKEYANNYMYVAAEERMNSLKNTELGATAPDFKIPDVNGDSISLSSFRGKYVLLDFWASWCVPCRKENPHVIEAYKMFKDKNFDILGVSYDYPNSKESWLNAIKQDGLTWTQVSNLSGWKDPTAKLYNISGIPSPFLIDPEGKIVAKGFSLREEKLIETLSSIFDKGTNSKSKK